MDFDLKRPCTNCPFRTDVPGYLRRDRAGEIARSLTVEGRTFACHKTVEHAPGADEEFEPTGEEKHCAGALLMLDHAGAQLPQLARIAGRLGVFDLDSMDHDAPVFESIAAFVRHHGEDPDPDEDEAPCCAMAEFGCDAPAGYAVGGGAVESDPEERGHCEECPGCGEPVCESCAGGWPEGWMCGYCREREEDAA